jgi:hypothetical protein
MSQSTAGTGVGGVGAGAAAAPARDTRSGDSGDDLMTMATRGAWALRAVLVLGLVATGGVVAALPAQAAVPPCDTAFWYSGTYIWDNSFREIAAYEPGTSRPGGGYCYLKSGMTNSGVKALQTALNKCYAARLVTDGVYGKRTRSWVIEVQRREGLLKDGEFGSQTLSYMYWPMYEKDRRTFAGCHSYKHNP